MNTRERRFYIEAIQANKKIWDGINELQALQDESNALDLGNTLPDGSEGEYPELQHINASDVLAVVHATTDAFQGLLNSGHATNMAKLL